MLLALIEMSLIAVLVTLSAKETSDFRVDEPLSVWRMSKWWVDRPSFGRSRDLFWF